LKPDFLFIITTNPIHVPLAQEVLSEVLTFAAFDVPLSVLFSGAGTRFLTGPIEPEVQGMMTSLPVYGVNEVYVDIESLGDGMSTSFLFPARIQRLCRSQCHELKAHHQHVIGDLSERSQSSEEVL
jgi:sulfur relay (sulfurtransferase) DsrF/TusC family protein